MTPILRAAAAIALLAACSMAPAQTWPTRPITVIVPYAAGGTSDIVTRIVAKKLGEALPVAVVVENRAGGGGTIGWSAGVKAAPDGYTILALETGFAMASATVAKLPFDPRRDLLQVAITLTVPFVMVVNPGLGTADVAAFIAQAKAKPGGFNYGSGGTASSSHLAGEWFKSLAGVDLTHVPYKGGGAYLQDLIGGHVQLSFPAVPSAHGFIKAGRLKALMVTSEKRIASLPEVPSAPEAGLPTMLGVNWFGFAVPAGTPRELIDRLNREIVATLATPEAKQRFVELGLDVVGNSPAGAAQFVADDIERWSALAKSANIRVE